MFIGTTKSSDCFRLRNNNNNENKLLQLLNLRNGRGGDGGAETRSYVGRLLCVLELMMSGWVFHYFVLRLFFSLWRHCWGGDTDILL